MVLPKYSIFFPREYVNTWIKFFFDVTCFCKGLQITLKTNLGCLELQIMDVFTANLPISDLEKLCCRFYNWHINFKSHASKFYLFSFPLMNLCLQMLQKHSWANPFLLGTRKWFIPFTFQWEDTLFIITIFHVPKIVLEAHIIALLSWIIQNHYSSYLAHAPRRIRTCNIIPTIPFLGVLEVPFGLQPIGLYSSLLNTKYTGFRISFNSSNLVDYTKSLPLRL